MDEGCPPGRARTLGKAALTPSLPQLSPLPRRAPRARSVLLARLNDNDCCRSPAPSRRALARNGPLSVEWRRGEQAIYRTKHCRCQLPPPSGNWDPASRAGEGQTWGPEAELGFPWKMARCGVEQPFLTVNAASGFQGRKSQKCRPRGERRVVPRSC